MVQSLVDDDMVTMDKIGTSNFYWSLKSEHANKARRAARSGPSFARGAASRHRAPQIRTKQESLAKEFTAAQAAHEELTTRVAEAKAARPDTARRHRCDC